MISYNEELAISQLSSRLEGFKRVGKNFNFRCPICFDSKIKKSKKRGWILTDRETPVFFCHNCSASMSFSDFLKQIDHSLYNEYIFNILKDKGKTSAYSDSFIPLPVQPKTPPPDYAKRFLEVCTPVTSLPLGHEGIKYLVQRNIPKDKYDLMYYVDDSRDLSNISTKYKVFDKDPRLVFPIWAHNCLVGVTCRSILPNPEKRYLMYRYSDKLPLVFNLFDINGKVSVDKTKPVYVTEGIFDSLFLENGIAVSGAGLKKVLTFMKDFDLVFIPDREPRNKEIVKVYKGIIATGKKIVVFPNNVKGKDLNEMVLSHGIGHVRNIINNNTFQGLMAQLKFENWKRC